MKSTIENLKKKIQRFKETAEQDEYLLLRDFGPYKGNFSKKNI